MQGLQAFVSAKGKQPPEVVGTFQNERRDFGTEDPERNPKKRGKGYGGAMHSSGIKA
jgi:hypothetical protein